MQISYRGLFHREEIAPEKKEVECAESNLLSVEALHVKQST